VNGSTSKHWLQERLPETRSSVPPERIAMTMLFRCVRIPTGFCHSCRCLESHGTASRAGMVEDGGCSAGMSGAVHLNFRCIIHFTIAPSLSMPVSSSGTVEPIQVEPGPARMNCLPVLQEISYLPLTTPKRAGRNESNSNSAETIPRPS
jgi:hypothetical protein